MSILTFASLAFATWPAFSQQPAVLQLGNFNAAENRPVTPPTMSPTDKPLTILRLETSTTKAAITALSWDTEGGGRAKTNLLRGPVRLDATIAGKKVSLADYAVQFEKLSADAILYKIAADRDITVSWEIHGQPDDWTMTFAWGDAYQKGLSQFELIFPFDPAATPTTFISEHWQGHAGTQIPGIISAPDLGQFLVNSPDCADMSGRLEGSRTSKTVDLIFELPVNSPQHDCNLRFSPIVLPTPIGVSPEMWVKARRGWFNLFNLSVAWMRPTRTIGANAGLFANNVISDPVSCLLHCHSDPVVLIPELAPGVSAARVLRHTLDYWLDNEVSPDGRVHYIPDAAIGAAHDGNPSLGAPIMDSNPSLLIAAWDYVAATEDKDWLLSRIDRIELIADYLARRDIDGDGVIESVPSGNRGTKAFGDTYMDTISSGHKNALCNALVYRAWRHLAELEERLGRHEQQQRYQKLALALRGAYGKAFFNPDTGWFGWWRSADGSLHDYAALIVNCNAVECGVVDRDRGREILNRLWAKMEQAGFRRLDLGVPNNLIPVLRDEQYANFGGSKEDGSDTFQHYCNGGVFPEDAIRCIAALYLVGESEKAEKLLVAMLDRQHQGGIFPNGSGFNAGVTNRVNTGPSISDWDGNPTEYEGFIPRDYAFLSGVFLREPEFRKKMYASVTPENVHEHTISEHSLSLPQSGETIKYLLYTPSNPSTKERSPLLVALYGAGGSLLEYDFKGPGYADLRSELNRLGYFVLVPDLGPRHCMNDRALKMLDLLLDEIQNDPRLDAERVDLLGTSMGGGSALAYALLRPRRVRSVVDHAGMTDFAAWIQENPSYQASVQAALGGSPEQVSENYRERSAVENAEKLKGIPILLIHGTKDVVVLPAHSTRLHDALQTHQGKSVLKLLEGRIHNNESMTGMGVEVADFLQKARRK